MGVLKKWPKNEVRFVLIGKLGYLVDKSGTNSDQIASGGRHSPSNNYTSTATSPSSSGPTSKLWGRTLKFSHAMAVLVSRSLANIDNEGGADHHANLDIYDDAQSETPNADEIFKLTSLTKPRSNSKSPSRINLSLSATKAPEKEAMLMLFKEKNGRYVLCRVSLLCQTTTTTLDSIDLHRMLSIWPSVSSRMQPNVITMTTSKFMNSKHEILY